ncbi:MAG: prepilin peptidase [Anaerovoracaceae bacterium]|jgi:prepilin signal peptidase PulO-like enzyme (type II secretory pathway)
MHAVLSPWLSAAVETAAAGLVGAAGGYAVARLSTFFTARLQTRPIDTAKPSKAAAPARAAGQSEPGSPADAVKQSKTISSAETAAPFLPRRHLPLLFLGAAGAVLLDLWKGADALTALQFFVLCDLLLLSLVDLKTMQIPLLCCAALAGAGLLRLFLWQPDWHAHPGGAAIISVPMLLLNLLRRGSFGGGDIALMAAGGFLLGWRAALDAALLGLLGGGLYAGLLLCLRKKKRTDHFPFAPFLSLGLAAAMLFSF